MGKEEGEEEKKRVCRADGAENIHARHAHEQPHSLNDARHSRLYHLLPSKQILQRRQQMVKTARQIDDSDAGLSTACSGIITR